MTDGEGWQPDFTKDNPYEGMPPEYAKEVEKYYVPSPESPYNPVEEAALRGELPPEYLPDKAGKEKPKPPPPETPDWSWLLELLAWALQEITRALVNGISDISDAIADGIRDISSAIHGGLWYVSIAASNGIYSISQAAKEAILKVSDAIADGIRDISSAIHDGLFYVSIAASNGIYSISEAAADAILNVSSAVASGIRDVSSAVASGVVKIQKTFSTLVAQFDNWWETQLDSIDSVFGWILNFRHNLEDFFGNPVEFIWGKFADWFLGPEG